MESYNYSTNLLRDTSFKNYNFSNKQQKYNIEIWLNKNRNALKKLYYSLISLSKSYGIILNDDDTSINNFIIMMYYESDKTIIDKNLYPEYFNVKYNSIGYEKYRIL
jgi:hypothetical protein